MTTPTERIHVLVTSKEKAMIAKKAQEAHVSMGEFLRRAALSFRPNEDEKMLEGMIGQMLKTTAQANAAIDDALSFVEVSNNHIRNQERQVRST